MPEMFLEVIMPADELRNAGFESRDEVEEPLADALAAQGVGELTGGGAGSGVVVIEVELNAKGDVEALRQMLRKIGVPRGTVIKQYSPKQESHPVYS